MPETLCDRSVARQSDSRELLSREAANKLFDYFNDYYVDDNYVCDVIDLCDSNGYVSERAARKLFNDHGSCMKEYIDAGNPANNALTILEWLGY